MDSSSNTMPFGKYSGKTYEEIRQADISYCNWVLKQYEARGKMLEFQKWLKSVSKKATCEVCNGTGVGHIM